MRWHRLQGGLAPMTDIRDISAAINSQVFALATWRLEAIDSALAILQPGWRLCLHGDHIAMEEVDTSIVRVRLEYHYLAADQQCEEPDRTEYGPA